MIQNKANVNQADKKRHTALHFAKKTGCEEAV